MKSSGVERPLQWEAIHWDLILKKLAKKTDQPLFAYLLICVCLLLLLFWVGKIDLYQVPVLPYYLISVERIQIDIFLSRMFFFPDSPDTFLVRF